MSQSMKKLPTHQTRSQSQKGMRNYSNVNLHTGLDIAKIYSGMVDSHFQASNYENHVLNSACRKYQKEIKLNNYRAKSAQVPIKNEPISEPISSPTKNEPISSPTKNENEPTKNINIKPIRVSQKKATRANPQELFSNNNSTVTLKEEEMKFGAENFSLLKSILMKKTERVPEYSQSLRNKQEQKLWLENQIKELKGNLNTEKKKKAKISLNCSKIMNEREHCLRNMCKKQEENYNIAIQIGVLEKEQNELLSQLARIQNKLAETVESVRSETETRDRVKKYVEETRLNVMAEERQVARMKDFVTRSYKIMTNSYMNMNQLKETKALLLSDIQAQYAKNG